MTEAQIGPVEAQRQAVRGQRSLGHGAAAEELDAIVHRVPALLPLRSAIGDNPTAQQTALAMVQTILEGLATIRR